MRTSGVRQVRRRNGRSDLLPDMGQTPLPAADEDAEGRAAVVALHDLQPRDVFRELLQEKQLPSEELSAAFDELLALREAKSIA
jgi:hypothetical protein